MVKRGNSLIGIVPRPGCMNCVFLFFWGDDFAVLSWVGGNEPFANWAVCLAWHRKSCGVGGSAAAAAAAGGGAAAAAVVVAAVVGDTVLCVVQLEEDAKRPSHYF